MAKPKLYETDFGGGVDALFGDIPEEPSVAQMLAIKRIKLPKQQPRRSFDSDALKALVTSIKKNGVLQPLVVRPLSNDSYELVAGERRYRASKTAGLEEIPCVVRELSSNEAYEIALVENLQREDLNPVDETEGILELLERLLSKSQSEIKAMFYRATHKDRAGYNVIADDDWPTVEQVFERISKISPESFATNRLPLLNMPEEVLDAVRAGELAYTKAKVIGRIKDDNERQTLLHETIRGKLSLTAIKSKIAAMKKEKQPKPKATVDKTLNRMNTLYKRAKNPDLWNKPAQRQRLDEILSVLEGLLDEIN